MEVLRKHTYISSAQLYDDLDSVGIGQIHGSKEGCIMGSGRINDPLLHSFSNRVVLNIVLWCQSSSISEQVKHELWIDHSYHEIIPSQFSPLECINKHRGLGDIASLALFPQVLWTVFSL